MKYCIDIINQYTKKRSSIFIENFYVNKKGNGYSSDTITFNLVKVVGVASTLGNSVSMKWLEIPFNNNFERVSLVFCSFGYGYLGIVDRNRVFVYQKPIQKEFYKKGIEKIGICSLMKINLSVDHRLIDGVMASKFLSQMKYYL